MEEELRQKYLELQVIQNQMEQLQKQLQSIEEQTMELSYIKQSLDDLKTVKKDTKILIPIASGIFAEASLAGNKILKVNVGDNVVVDKNIEETKKLMDKQTQDISRFRDQIVEHLQGLLDSSKKLEEHMAEIVKKR